MSDFKPIPTVAFIRITKKKKNTNREFWKDVDSGDTLKISHFIFGFGFQEAPKVYIEKNGDLILNSIGEANGFSEKTMTEMLTKNFEYELLTEDLSHYFDLEF